MQPTRSGGAGTACGRRNGVVAKEAGGGFWVLWGGCRRATAPAGHADRTVRNRIDPRRRRGRGGRWRRREDARRPPWQRSDGPRRRPRAGRGPGGPARRPRGPADGGVPGMEFEMGSMEIDSTRFGRLVVDDERVMTFPNGLLGFPDHARYALIQTSAENYFFWLQSVDDPNLAFVITDPTVFFRDYSVPLREETRADLRLADADPEARAETTAANPLVQVFVICNKVGDWLTGNLLGPIVVNLDNRLAQQVVLTEKKWTTRQPLLRLAGDVPLAKSA